MQSRRNDSSDEDGPVESAAAELVLAPATSTDPLAPVPSAAGPSDSVEPPRRLKVNTLPTVRSNHMVVLISLRP